MNAAKLELRNGTGEPCPLWESHCVRIHYNSIIYPTLKEKKFI